MHPHAARIGHHLWRAKINIQRFIVAFCGLSITAMVFIQVIARYLLDVSVFGLEELATYVAVWFYFLGGAIGSEQRGHISASLVDVVIKNERIHLMIRIFTDALSVVLCGWMTWWGFQFASWSSQFGMMSTELRIPMSLVHAAVPVGLALMTLYMLHELIENILKLSGRHPE